MDNLRRGFILDVGPVNAGANHFYIDLPRFASSSRRMYSHDHSNNSGRKKLETVLTDKPQVVAVASGGREYNFDEYVYALLDKAVDMFNIDFLVEGGAPFGVDRFVREWRKVRKVAGWSEYAQWHRYGRAAGPIRNQKMLNDWRPRVVLIFPGGKGTADCRDKALAGGYSTYYTPHGSFSWKELQAPSRRFTA